MIKHTRNLHLQSQASWQPYVFFDKEFSPSECETILHLAKFAQPMGAMTGGTDAPNTDKKIRSSELHWLWEDEQNKWIFDRLEGVCAKVRANWYPFHMTAFREPLQITHYRDKDEGHYDWHQDFGPNEMSTRKLSIVVLLNDPAEFEGGELEVMAVPGENKKVDKLLQGTVVAFPSWELHRVLKITKGDRWSLVTWVHGPPFA